MIEHVRSRGRHAGFRHASPFLSLGTLVNTLGPFVTETIILGSCVSNTHTNMCT